MQLAKIIGTVVCTRKDERMNGMKFLIVQPVGLLDLKPEGKPLVAVDSVGAGEGELVLIVSGSSARLTAVTKDKPSDATIMAIVDYIDIEQRRVFSKGETQV